MEAPGHPNASISHPSRGKRPNIYGIHLKLDIKASNTLDSAALSNGDAPLFAECRTKFMLMQALLRVVEYAFQSKVLPKAESVPVSTRKSIPLMVTFDELAAGFVKLVVRHGLRTSTTTTSRYFSVRFVPEVNGSETRALLSENTVEDEFSGSVKVKPYFELEYTFDGGMGVEVGVGTTSTDWDVAVATGVPATLMAAKIGVSYWEPTPKVFPFGFFRIQKLR